MSRLFASGGQNTQAWYWNCVVKSLGLMYLAVGDSALLDCRIPFVSVRASSAESFLVGLVS